MASQPKTPLKVVGGFWLKFSQKTQFISGNKIALVWATRGPYQGIKNVVWATGTPAGL